MLGLRRGEREYRVRPAPGAGAITGVARVSVARVSVARVSVVRLSVFCLRIDHGRSAHARLLLDDADRTFLRLDFPPVMPHPHLRELCPEQENHSRVVDPHEQYSQRTGCAERTARV